MTKIPESQLTQMEARHGAATRGRWVSTKVPEGTELARTGVKFYVAPAPHCTEVVCDLREVFGHAAANADFIAKAHQDIPLLIAALREAYADNDALERVLLRLQATRGV